MSRIDTRFTTFSCFRCALVRTVPTLVCLLFTAATSQGQGLIPPVPATELPATSLPGAELQAADQPATTAETLSVTEALLQDRPIGQLQATIKPPGPDSPENLAKVAMQAEGQIPMPYGQGRGWMLQPYIWDASAVRHLPTYFEEPNLERLGYYYGFAADRHLHDRFWGLPNASDPRFVGADGVCFNSDDYLASERPRAQYLQPVVSALNFYGRVAIIPYMVGAQDHLTPVYGLGEDRPGSPVPYRKHYMPLSAMGILYQGSAATGLGFLIP